jgi:hypothetical protein
MQITLHVANGHKLHLIAMQLMVIEVCLVIRLLIIKNLKIFLLKPPGLAHALS